MTKADLIDEVSRLAELTRKDSEVIVETIFGLILSEFEIDCIRNAYWDSCCLRVS